MERSRTHRSHRESRIYNFARILAEAEIQLGTRFRDRFDKKSGGDGGGDTQRLIRGTNNSLSG